MDRLVPASLLCPALVAVMAVFSGAALAATPLIDTAGTDPASPILKDGQVTFQYRVWGDWTVASVACTVVIMRDIRDGRDSVIVDETGPFTVYASHANTDVVVRGPTWTCSVRQGYYRWMVEPADAGIASTDAGLRVVRRLPPH